MHPTFHTDFNNSPKMPLWGRSKLAFIISVAYYNKMSRFALISKSFSD